MATVVGQAAVELILDSKLFTAQVIAALAKVDAAAAASAASMEASFTAAFASISAQAKGTAAAVAGLGTTASAAGRSAAVGLSATNGSLASQTTALKTLASGYDGLQGAISRAASATTAIGLGLTTIGAATALFSLKASADLELVTLGFQGLLQETAKGADEFTKTLVSFAAETPFQIGEVTKATQRLLGAGFNRDAILPTLTSIGDFAALIGSTGAEVNGFVRALAQISGKGIFSADNVRQLTENLPGLNAMKLIAEQLGITVPEAFDMMKDKALTADIGIKALLDGMSQFPGAAGAMQRASKTLTGEVSNLKDSFTLISFETARSSGLLDSSKAVIVGLRKSLSDGVAGEGLKDALSGISEAFTQFAPTIPGLVAGITTGVGEFFKAAGPGFTDLFGSLGDGAASFGAAVGKAFGAILSVTADVIDALAPLTSAIASLDSQSAKLLATFGLFVVLAPFDKMLEGLVGLANAGKAAIKVQEDLAKAAAAAATAQSIAAAGGTAGATTAPLGFIGNAKAGLSSIASSAGPILLVAAAIAAIGLAISQSEKGFKPLLDGLSSLGTTVLPGLTEIGKGFLAFLKPVGDLVNTMLPLMIAQTKLIAPIFGLVFTQIGKTLQLLSLVVEKIAEWASLVTDQLLGGFNAVADAVSSIVDLVNPFNDAVESTLVLTREQTKELEKQAELDTLGLGQEVRTGEALRAHVFQEQLIADRKAAQLVIEEELTKEQEKALAAAEKEAAAMADQVAQAGYLADVIKFATGDTSELSRVLDNLSFTAIDSDQAKAAIKIIQSAFDEAQKNAVSLVSKLFPSPVSFWKDFYNEGKRTFDVNKFIARINVETVSGLSVSDELARIKDQFGAQAFSLVLSIAADDPQGALALANALLTDPNGAGAKLETALQIRAIIDQQEIDKWTSIGVIIGEAVATALIDALDGAIDGLLNGKDILSGVRPVAADTPGANGPGNAIRLPVIPVFTTATADRLEVMVKPILGPEGIEIPVTPIVGPAGVPMKLPITPVLGPVGTIPSVPVPIIPIIDPTTLPNIDPITVPIIPTVGNTGIVDIGSIAPIPVPVIPFVRTQDIPTIPAIPVKLTPNVADLRTKLAAAALTATVVARLIIDPNNIPTVNVRIGQVIRSALGNIVSGQTIAFRDGGAMDGKSVANLASHVQSPVQGGRLIYAEDGVSEAFIRLDRSKGAARSEQILEQVANFYGKQTVPLDTPFSSGQGGPLVVQNITTNDPRAAADLSHARLRSIFANLG